MKKVVSLFLSVVMLLSITAGLSFNAVAAEREACVFSRNAVTFAADKSDVYIDYYADDSNNTAEICGISGKDAASVIYLDLPTTVGNGKYTVTSISEYAFYGNTNIKEVTIPDTVKTIGEYAFYGCSNIVSVDLGNGVQSIGKSAFVCASLFTLHMPKSLVSIADYAFDRCNNLKVIFYRGTENQLNNIKVGSYNNPLRNATVYVNSYFCSDSDHDGYWFSSNGNVFVMCDTCGLLLYALQFNDLNGMEKYADYIMYTSVYNSFITGTNPPTNNVFSPKLAITRAMFITILYRMAGSPYDNGRNPYGTRTPFTDITNTSAYYYNAACWALDEGVTDQTTFKPFNNVSREMTATMLFRYAKENGFVTDNDYKNVNLNKFYDLSSVSKWAVEALQWSNYTGMITGTDQGYLNPQGATQRIHATKILYNFGVACGIGEGIDY